MATKEQDENSVTPLEPTEVLPKNRRGRPEGEGILPHLNDLVNNCGRGRKYAETLDQLAIRSKSDTVRLAAIGEIFDRVHGKAVQTVNQKGIFVMAAPSDASLAALDAWADGD